MRNAKKSTLTLFSILVLSLFMVQGVNALNPTVTVTSPTIGDEEWSGTNIVNWTAEDVTFSSKFWVFAYKDDNPETSFLIGDTLSRFATTLSWNTLNVPGNNQDGLYKIHVIMSEDGANALAEDASDEFFILDNTNPTSLLDEVNDYYNTPSFEITYNANDVVSNGVSSGLDYVNLYYKKDGGSWTFYDSFRDGMTFDASDGDGTYEFHSKAVDEAGNIESTPISADTSAVIDTADPVGILNGVPETWIGDDVTLTLSCSDDGSGCDDTEDYYGTADTELGCVVNTAYTTDVVINTRKWVCWKVQDNAGNYDSGSAEVLIDKSPPNVTITNAPAGRVIDPSGVIPSMTCNDNGESGCDNDTRAFYISTSSVADCEAVLDVDYNETVDTIYAITDHSWVCAKATDNAGKTGYSDVAEFYVFSTIQSAIDDASAGDTIEVVAGTYNEALVINKALTIQGENRDTTIIDGEGMLSLAVDIQDQVTFQGFTVRNFTSLPDNYIGAILVEGNGSVINNNIIEEIRSDVVPFEPAGIGIDVHASNVNVTNNIVRNVDSQGIRVRHTWNEAEAPTESNNVLIDNNEVYRTANSNVIITGHAKGVTVSNNLIYESLEPTPYSLIIGMGASDVTVEGNDIRGGAANVIVMGSWGININNNVIANAINHYSDPDNLKGKNIYIRPNSWYELPQQTPGVLSRDIEITNNDITGATGEGVLILGTVDGADTASSTTINNNIIEGNTLYGVENQISTDVNATNNYWGHVSGPSGEGTGIGDSVSTDVSYTPWYVEPGIPDTTAPTSSVTTLVTYSNSWNLEIPYTASDDWGLLRINLYKNINDGGWNHHAYYSIADYPTSYDGSISFTAPSDGAYDFYIKAKDVVLNEEVKGPISEGTIIVDTTTPVVTIDAVITPTSTATQTITGTFIEVNLDTITVNGVVATTEGGIYSATDVPLLIEGNNIITVIATDLAGNTIQDTTTTIVLDTTGPVIDPITIVEQRTLDQETEIFATIIDENTISDVILSYTVNGILDSITMTNEIGDIYNGTIPVSTEKTNVIYSVTATDEFATTTTSIGYTITISNLILDLSAAWNLVSVPKTLEATSKEVLLPNNNVWYFDATETDPANQWKIPTDIGPGIGYWIDNANKTDLELDYLTQTSNQTMPSETIYLQPGWNLMGHMCTDDQQPTDAFGNAYDYMFVLKHDRTTDTFTVHDVAPNDFDLTPGEGYWVFLVSGNSLPYTNFC